jgi:hypothetical protein
MVRAWRVMVMHARDSVRGMLALDEFARRVVRNMPTADVATRRRGRVRSSRRDGVRSAMAAERTAAMTTSPTTATTAMSTATATASAATGVAAAATTAGGC